MSNDEMPSGKIHCGAEGDCNLSCYTEETCACSCSRCGPYNEWRGTHQHTREEPCTVLCRKDIWMVRATAPTTFAIAGDNEGICFRVGKELEVLRLSEDGKIYVHGREAANDLEVISGLKEWLRVARYQPVTLPGTSKQSALIPERCSFCLQRFYEDQARFGFNGRWFHDMCRTHWEEYDKLLGVVGAALLFKQETSFLHANEDVVQTARILRILLDELPAGLKRLAFTAQAARQNNG